VQEQMVLQVALRKLRQAALLKLMVLLAALWQAAAWKQAML
jgi:hypothetical protein